MMTFPKPDQGKEAPPVPLVSKRPAAAHYPVHALPPLMRHAAEAIAYHVQAPLALAGQCVIGAAAYLAQTRVNAPHHQRPDGMPCSLFMLTLANSGDRKSECRRLAFREIDEAERQARTDYRKQVGEVLSQADRLKGIKRDEFLADNPLPPDPRTQYADATFEPIVGEMIRGASQACWDTDEGGQLFGGASLKADTRAATIGGLIKAFDSGFFERTRSRGNAEGSGFAYHRRLAILMLAQPVTIAEALQDPLLREQGFLPRFLFCSAESLAGTRLLTPERVATKSYGDVRLQRFWERCRDLLASPAYVAPDTGEVLPPVIELSPAADQVWLKFYNETEVEQAPLGEFVGVQPFAARSGELAKRLAAVFACFAGMKLIDADTMVAACLLVRHSVTEWTRYSEEMQPDTNLVQASALMSWLKEHCRAERWQSFHRNDLGKSGPGFVRKAGNRDKLLMILVAHLHLFTDDDRHYRINPLAEVEDPAELRAPSAIGAADDVRKAAETAVLGGDESGQEIISARFRNLSAAGKPDQSGFSAESATSATAPAEREVALYRGTL